MMPDRLRHNKYKKESGQLIIELMVASSLMIVGMLGIFTVLSQSLGLSRVVSNQYVAANLAAEGVEITKNIIDSKTLAGEVWGAGLHIGEKVGVEYGSYEFNKTLANRKLKYDPDMHVYGYNVGEPTNFTRTISLSQPMGDDAIQVVSEVSWKDRGGTEFNIVLEDRFTNWR